MAFIAWLKDVFRNDDIVSAVSGTEVEKPFTDLDRKRRAQVYTALGYPAIVLLGFLIASLMPEPPPVEDRWDPPGLVFVIEPGPGGGGGGGDGNEEPLSLQQIQGEDAATVAVNVEVPPDELVFDDPDKENEPEEDEAEEPEEEDDAPEIKAPVVAQAPDDENTRGALEGLDALLANAGSGTGGGIGEGEGAGLGPGRGGGFGGGAYRMGSGIEPPRLVKDSRPQYTEDALARKVEGVVELEVVIGKEGRIGQVRVKKGLPGGLNDRAIQCVRQWVFVPGKFKGDPVDVLAEIAVEFSIL